MSRVLAIDPGNEYTGYALLDSDYTPIEFGKVENAELLERLPSLLKDTEVVIEMVASYGMAVGQTVFETCVWIGRFMQKIYDASPSTKINRVKRKEYVTELCGSAKAKDANVIQYLIDRFAENTPNRGKGTKQAPGWFYGFKADVWQAYAIGVWANDKKAN